MTTAVQDRNRADQPAPTVSVQIAVYNGARFLAATLDSLLSQTWTDFELIVVDDGSSDATPQLLAEYAAREPRISLLHNPTRQGVSAARNRALAVSRGRYVAISDADDCSYPQRLEKQVAFLDEHPEIGVVSSGISWLDETGQPLHKEQRPADDGVLRWRLHFSPPVVHTASMLRRRWLQAVGGYDEAKPCAVDYDLWLRLAPYTKFHNLQEELVVRRNHRQRISVQHDEEQNRIASQIAQSALTKLLKQPVAFEVAYTLRAIAISRPIQTDRGRLQEAAHLLPYIYQAYTEQGSLTAKERRLLIAELALYFRCLARYQRQQGAWWGYLHSHWQARRIQLCRLIAASWVSDKQ